MMWCEFITIKNFHQLVVCLHYIILKIALKPWIGNEFRQVNSKTGYFKRFGSNNLFEKINQKPMKTFKIK